MTRPPVTPSRAELVQSLWVQPSRLVLWAEASCWGPKAIRAAEGLRIDQAKSLRRATERNHSRRAKSSWHPAIAQSCPTTQ